MGVSKGIHFSERDIYIDYDFEEVMFRSDHVTGGLYRKFYGKSEEIPVAGDNRLFNDALLYGNEITKEEYLNGKPHR